LFWRIASNHFFIFIHYFEFLNIDKNKLFAFDGMLVYICYHFEAINTIISDSENNSEIIYCIFLNGEHILDLVFSIYVLKLN
jgi:hypothetical protein